MNCAVNYFISSTLIGNARAADCNVVLCTPVTRLPRSDRGKAAVTCQEGFHEVLGVREVNCPPHFLPTPIRKVAVQSPGSLRPALLLYRTLFPGKIVHKRTSTAMERISGNNLKRTPSRYAILWKLRSFIVYMKMFRFSIRLRHKHDSALPIALGHNSIVRNGSTKCCHTIQESSDRTPNRAQGNMGVIPRYFRDSVQPSATLWPV